MTASKQVPVASGASSSLIGCLLEAHTSSTFDVDACCGCAFDLSFEMCDQREVKFVPPFAIHNGLLLRNKGEYLGTAATLAVDLHKAKPRVLRELRDFSFGG